MWKRYVTYLTDLLQGDLGTSYQRGTEVSSIILQKYPYTVQLALVAIVIEAVVGIGAGIISAIKRYSFWDILVTLVTSLLVAMPAFWFGMLLQLFFGVWLPASPAARCSSHLRCGGPPRPLPRVDVLHPARLHARGGVDGLHGAHHALAAA